MSSEPTEQIPFLSIGFRPFFLLAGLYAIASMSAWLAWLAVHAANGIILEPTIAVPAHLWHGHEMLFGYTAAVITGFMLTAVPGWTGAQRVAGPPLVFLMGVWIAGRLVVWFSALLPPLFVAAIDMAHLPLLAGIVALGLIRRPAPRNLIFLGLLIILIIANGAIHAEWTGLSEDSAAWGLNVALITMTLLVVILGGRIVPSFTRNALKRRGVGRERDLPRSIAMLDKASIAGVAALLVCYLFPLPDPITGIAAALAACANLARLSLWRWRSVLDAPILWSLHLAYLWIPLGLAGLAAALLGGWFSHNAALHILAVGAVGGMTMAMMTRAPLGHTGRPLVVAVPIAGAYLLIAAAALLRGFALEAFPAHYYSVIFSAGGLWIAGFIVFVIVYLPILTGPPLKNQPSD